MAIQIIQFDPSKQKIEDRDHDIKKDKNILLEVRSARFHSKSRFELTWPDNSVIYFAGKKISEFKPLARNTALKRRNDEEIVLEKGIVIGSNDLIIEEKGTGTEQRYLKSGRYDHLIIVVACTQPTQQQLFHKLHSKILSVQDSRKILKKYINKSTSNEITVEKLSVSLQCQYYDKSILWPVRSKHCISHYQPFDLQSFLIASMSPNKNVTLKWKCPICKKRAYDIIVDEYLLNIIRKNRHMNIKEIIIRAFDAEPQIIEKEIQKDISSWEENEQKETEKMFEKAQQPKSMHQHTIVLDSEEQEMVQIPIQQPNITSISINNNSQQHSNDLSNLISHIETQQPTNLLPQCNIQPINNQYNLANLSPIHSSIDLSNSKQNPIPINSSHKSNNNLSNQIYIESEENQCLVANKDFKKLQQSKEEVPLAEEKKRPNQSYCDSSNSQKNQKPRKIRKLPEKNKLSSQQIELFSNYKPTKNVPSLPVQSSKNKQFNLDIDKYIISSNTNKPRSEMEPIQIESDDQPPQTLQQKKIQEERGLLQSMKKSMNKKYNDCAISQSDIAIMDGIWMKFIDINFND